MPMTPSESYARTFESHRGALIDLYAQLPEEHGTFSAWEGGMSLIGQADHLAASSTMMLAMIAGESPARPAPGAGSASVAEVRERLRTTTERVAAAIRTLGPDDLARRVPAFGGREMPVTALLDALIGHEAHHKGQVWVMARMVGLKPPMFVRMG
ncbi:DinB family protein [Deinococcus planocerae]|uniref:DinB family protein n=1 Tax=Deinococcus planocerae TaxID=1737569 RepID=UPI000C7E9062|nr:DinB family protein [Deinococcus planocerae]